MSEVLGRLSKIITQKDFVEWAKEGVTYFTQIEQIREVVSIAKAKQQPNIDAMRFEVAKAAMQSSLSNSAITSVNSNDTIARISVQLADTLIAELQKQKP